MIHEAVFTITSHDAPRIVSSLEPEEKEQDLPRSTGTCRLIDQDTAELLITADDITALRASLNTWLRLVQVASEIVVISKQWEDKTSRE